MTYMEKVFLEQPRRGNTCEAQLTPHKRSAVWGDHGSVAQCSALVRSAAQCSARVQSTVWGIRMSIALMLLLAMQPATAQRERTRTVTATGEYVANQNETPAYGKAQALLEAKKQALREAGVMEEISSTAILVMGGGEDDFREISSELSRIELEGRVRVKEQTDALPQFTNGGLVKYSTTIRAEVVVEETEEDLGFQFKTDGFRNTYRDGEKMTFTVTPTADCYLRIFFLGKTSAASAQIYPIEDIFKDVQLKAGQPVLFPPEGSPFVYDQPFEYTMELDNKRDHLEQDLVLIVALKKPYPFVDEVSYENVISWLARIKRNEKSVQWHGVNIVN